MQQTHALGTLTIELARQPEGPPRPVTLSVWCTAAYERLELDGFIIRRAILPPPPEGTAPFACLGAHSRRGRLALVTLLLIIDLRPEGMPRGFRRPLHERVAQEGRTLEGPVYPRLLATACRDRSDARAFWECFG
jgi:hypothetical protein